MPDAPPPRETDAPRHHAVQVPATTANIGAGFDAFGAAIDRHLFARSVPRATHHDRVVTRGEGSDEVDRGEDNLVWRSLVRFCDHARVAVPDVALEVTNHIPLERGLGSSSAAIVAGMSLGRAITGVRVSDRDVIAMASEVEGHPDNVAPAVLGGLTASATTPDGRLVVRRIPVHARLVPVVFVPATRQATIAARTVLPATLSRAQVAEQVASAGHVLAGLGGLWPVDAELSGDVLHEPSRLAVMTDAAEVIADLRALGLHAWLSGAGPTVAAALAPDPPTLERCAAIANDHGVAMSVSRWDLAGARTCPDDGCGIVGSGQCVQCPARGV